VSRPSTNLHLFAVFTAVATFILILAGGLVSSTGSGLSVPDWPLSFGQVFPPMRGGVLFEHGHRMIASVVGALTVVLAIWMWLAEPRRGVRALALAALLAVVCQGLLGGITVLWKLPTAVSVAHACLAQTFLCAVVVLALCTSRRWNVPSIARTGDGRPRLAHLALVTTLAVYGQLILGALVRHTGSGLAIPDFPLAFGGLLPPAFPQPVLIHFLHRIGATVVTVLTLWTAARVWNAHRDEPLLLRPAVLLLGFVLVQISLGASIIWTWRAVVPTTAHVATGAASLASGLLLSIRAYRLLAAPVRVAVPRWAARRIPA